MGVKLRKDTMPDRNDPCPCKSGLKYKHCHGDIVKQQTCTRIANEKMVELIQAEISKREARKQQEQEISKTFEGKNT